MANRTLFRNLALFIGVIALGSSLPDIFRFIEGKEWLGHSFLIPVVILAFVGVTYLARLVTKYILGLRVKV